MRNVNLDSHRLRNEIQTGSYIMTQEERMMVITKNH